MTWNDRHDPDGDRIAAREQADRALERADSPLTHLDPEPQRIHDGDEDLEQRPIGAGCPDPVVTGRSAAAQDLRLHLEGSNLTPEQIAAALDERFEWPEIGYRDWLEVARAVVEMAGNA